MGVLDFFKKDKLPNPQPVDLSNLNIETSINIPQMPQLDNSLQNNSLNLPQLDSLNVPPLDTQLNIPPLDFNMQNNNLDNALNSLNTSSNNDLNTNMNTGLNVSQNTSDTDDDLNKLFISDPWNEPDWSTFDPYSDPVIEQPTAKDFGMDDAFMQSMPGSVNNVGFNKSDLPDFEEQEKFNLSYSDDSLDSSYSNNDAYIDSSPKNFERDKSRIVPVELFVKGSD